MAFASVRLVGGTGDLNPQVMWIGILPAARWFGWKGGVLAGVAAGLLVGPLMPLSSDPREAQETADWLTRLAIFAALAGAIGRMFEAADHDAAVARERAAALTNARRGVQLRDQLLAATLESTADGILVIDQDGQPRYTNRRLREIWDLPEDASGLEVLSCMREQVEAPDWLDECLRAGTPSDAPIESLRLTNGREVEVVGREMEAAEGVMGRVWSFRDVTEQRRLMAQYLQSQRMESLGRLAGGIAHDVSNLMTSIMGFAGYNANLVPEDDPLHADLLEISATARKAGDLTQQLLAFSRRAAYEPVRIDMNDVVRDTERMLGRVIEERITLRVQLGGEPLPVFVDPAQLGQVLVNLVVNAADAIEGHGSIVIQTGAVHFDPDDRSRPESVAPGDYMMLSVSDDGHGIGLDILPNIFEPFFTTKPEGRGTGLGLSTCYGIVTRASGRITVDSEVGVGTTFRVFFPPATSGLFVVREAA